MIFLIGSLRYHSILKLRKEKEVKWKMNKKKKLFMKVRKNNVHRGVVINN